MGDVAIREVDDANTVRLLKGVLYGGPIVGLIVFARRSRLFAQYQRVSQIPPVVYAKGIELKGIVRAVYPNGFLKVEHQPTIRLPDFLGRRRYAQPGLLDVRLAGIDVSDAGGEYIVKDLRLRSISILFTAIRPIDNNKCIDCEVFFKKRRFWQTNLNVELVRRGFARVLPLENVEHSGALKSLPAYSRLVSKLIMSEKIADRRGLGLWRRDTWAETVVSYPSLIKQIVLSAAITRFLIAAFVLSKEMTITGVRYSRRVYKYMVAFIQLAMIQLQKFGDASSRISQTMRQKISRYSK